MKAFFYFFILLLPSTSVLARDYWVNFGKDKVMLKRFQEGFINQDCKDCSAQSSLKTKVHMKSHELIDKNPGSVRCHKLKGKINIGRLYSGHSQSFCTFQDGSLISTNVYLK